MLLHARCAALLALLLLGTSASRGAAAPDENPPASLPGFDAELGAIAEKLHDLARTDPALAFATYGPEFWRYRLAFHLASAPLQRWAERDLAAPFLWLADQPRGLNDGPSWWIYILPNSPDYRALADVLLHAPGPVNRETLACLSRPWAESHPAEAFDWINALSDPGLRADCIEKANSRYGIEPPLPFPEQTLRLVLALPPGEHRDRQLAEVLAGWLLRSPAAAESWASRRPEPEITRALARARESLASELAQAYPGKKLGLLAYRDPAAAIDEWEKETDEQIKADALVPIIQAWGQQDPGAALRWGVPRENDFSARGVFPLARGARMGPRVVLSKYDGYNLHYDLIQAWAETQPLEAVRWAENQPRDQSELGYSYIWAIGFIRSSSCKPVRAKVAQIYTLIRDPDLRLETLRRHFKGWSDENPAAARAWVETCDALTPEQRATILAAKP